MILAISWRWALPAGAATIKAVEDAMDKAFDGYDVRRAFTADTIIEHVYRRDGVRIDNVKEALERE